MSHLNENTQRLVSLYKDTEFKAAFTLNYLNRFSLARIEQEYVWAFGTITRSQATANSPALSSLSNESIKRVLLTMSAAGLSFDTQEKHFYLKTELGIDGAVIPRVILGYLGMKQLAMNSGLVKAIGNDIVYESDSFTWYGSNKEPAFSSTCRNPTDNVVCGYVCLYMVDGSVYSYRMSSAELLSIEENDMQMREEMGTGKESSLYSGPWRERCLRIALWRCAYREFKHLFTKDELLIEQEKSTGETNSDSFSSDFAAALNNTAEVTS
jgi:hypothetical protein